MRNNKKKMFLSGKLLIYLLLYLITGWIITSSIFLTPHALTSPLLTLLQAVIIFFASILLTRYTLYMLIAPWYRLTHEHRTVARLRSGTPALVSVLIPAWNEEVGLLSTVKTVLASTYPRLEIVVVNDGSTDGSDAVMHNFLIRYWWSMASLQRGTYPEIIYAYQPNGGKGSALNHAIALAHGSVLVTVDADCIVDRHAVAAFARAFEEDSRVMAAVGNVKIGNTGTLLGTLQKLEYQMGFSMKRADSIFNCIYIIGGAAGAFRREVFQRLGGFSETNITEDIEMSVKCQEAGMKIVYVPDAVVYTEGASTLKGLMKQRLRWKRGWFETFIQHPIFFSCKKEHNKLLTWIVLPMALFSNIQLGCEPGFLLALYLFSLFSQNYTSFYSGLTIVTTMFVLQAWENRHESGLKYLWLAPITWLLFYISTFTEAAALIMSIWGHIRKTPVKWQRWQRKGVVDE